MKRLRKVHFMVGEDAAVQNRTQRAEFGPAQRVGVFHTWGNVLRWDEVTSSWHECTMAIVEESVTGRVFEVSPSHLYFVQDAAAWHLHQ